MVVLLYKPFEAACVGLDRSALYGRTASNFIADFLHQVDQQGMEIVNNTRGSG